MLLLMGFGVLGLVFRVYLEESYRSMPPPAQGSPLKRITCHLGNKGRGDWENLLVSRVAYLCKP